MGRPVATSLTSRLLGVTLDREGLLDCARLDVVACVTDCPTSFCARLGCRLIQGAYNCLAAGITGESPYIGDDIGAVGRDIDIHDLPRNVQLAETYLREYDRLSHARLCRADGRIPNARHPTTNALRRDAADQLLAALDHRIGGRVNAVDRRHRPRCRHNGLAWRQLIREVDAEDFDLGGAFRGEVALLADVQPDALMSGIERVIGRDRADQRTCRNGCN